MSTYVWMRVLESASRRYDLGIQLLSFGHIEKVYNRVAQLARGPEVLDLGCGTGNVALGLARRGLRVTGVDLSPEMLDLARRKTPPGVVGVLYVDYDDSGTATIFRHRFARSFNRGLTWSERNLQSMDPEPLANAYNEWLWGDYEGLTAAKNIFYGVFTGESSGRTTPQLDPIFFRQKSCRWWWISCWLESEWGTWSENKPFWAVRVPDFRSHKVSWLGVATSHGCSRVFGKAGRRLKGSRPFALACLRAHPANAAQAGFVTR